MKIKYHRHTSYLFLYTVVLQGATKHCSRNFSSLGGAIAAQIVGGWLVLAYLPMPTPSPDRGAGSSEEHSFGCIQLLSEFRFHRLYKRTGASNRTLMSPSLPFRRMGWRFPAENTVLWERQRDGVLRVPTFRRSAWVPSHASSHRHSKGLQAAQTADKSLNFWEPGTNAEFPCHEVLSLWKKGNSFLTWILSVWGFVRPWEAFPWTCNQLIISDTFKS